MYYNNFCFDGLRLSKFQKLNSLTVCILLFATHFNNINEMRLFVLLINQLIESVSIYVYYYYYNIIENLI